MRKLSLTLLILSACAPTSPPTDAPPPGVEDEVDIILGDPLVLHAEARGVEVSEVQTVGSFVLYCNGIGGLFFTDASNPGGPTPPVRIDSALSHPQFPRCQHTSGTLDGTGALDRVAFTNKGDELQPTPFVSVVEVSTGAELGPFVSPGVSFEGVAMRDDLVFAAAHGDGLFILEVEAGDLVERARLDGFENAWGLELLGNTLVVADGTGGIKLVDVSDPTAPAFVGALDLPGASLDVEIDAATQLAYLAAGGSGVHVVDLAGPDLVTTIDTPGSALQVALAGERIYVADWNDVRLYDVADPAAVVALGKERPQVESAFPRVLGIAARDDAVFVGEWTKLWIYEPQFDVGAPDIQLSVRDVIFETTPVGETTSKAIIVENVGALPLEVSEIKIPGPFTASPSSLVVAPGQASLVELLFTPVNDTLESHTLTVCSNDIDEPERDVFVFGNPPPGGTTIGGPAPETRVNLVEGGQLDVAELRGNVVLLAYFATF